MSLTDSAQSNQLSSLKSNIYKALVYSIIYFSLGILLLFSIGAVIFSVPPLCNLMGLGKVSTFIICALCAVSTYWSTYVVQGTSIRDCILKMAGLSDEIPEDDASMKASKTNILLVSAAWTFYSIYCIGGNYYSVQQIFSSLGLEVSSLTIGIALFLSIYNHLPTCAVNGVALMKTALGYSPFDSSTSTEIIDLSDDKSIQPDLKATQRYVGCQNELETPQMTGRPILNMLATRIGRDRQQIDYNGNFTRSGSSPARLQFNHT